MKTVEIMFYNKIEGVTLIFYLVGSQVVMSALYFIKFSANNITQNSQAIQVRLLGYFKLIKVFPVSEQWNIMFLCDFISFQLFNIDLDNHMLSGSRKTICLNNHPNNSIYFQAISNLVLLRLRGAIEELYKDCLNLIESTEHCEL